MDEIAKTIRYNSLLLIYQNLLSDTQKEILTDYFSYNLSISEIAEERNVSRAAIEDAIKKGMKKLDTFENELHILEKNEKILSIVKEIRNNKNKTDDLLDEIERMIK